MICALFSGGAALAVNKTCTGGNMSVAANWGGTVPVAADVLRINGACVVDSAFANLAYSTLEVSRGAAPLRKMPPQPRACHPERSPARWAAWSREISSCGCGDNDEMPRLRSA